MTIPIGADLQSILRLLQMPEGGSRPNVDVTSTAGPSSGIPTMAGGQGHPDAAGLTQAFAPGQGVSGDMSRPAPQIVSAPSAAPMDETPRDLSALRSALASARVPSVPPPPTLPPPKSHAQFQREQALIDKNNRAYAADAARRNAWNPSNTRSGK